MSETPWSGTRELWVLNPGPAIDIAFDHGVTNFVFSERTYKFKGNMRLDPERQLEAASRGRAWRAILVEYDSNMAVEFTSRVRFHHPVGVYRCWDASNDMRYSLYDKLDDKLNLPGDLVGRMAGDGQEFRIVKDQSKRIFITGSPSTDIDWNAAMKTVGTVKSRHPDWIFHFHAGKSLRRTMGIGVDAFDHPIRTRWIDGLPALVLPNGHEYRPGQELTKGIKDWARMIGMDIEEVLSISDRHKLSREAFKFSLRSIRWLFMNYDNAWKPGRGEGSGGETVDTEPSDVDWEPLEEPVYKLSKGLPVLPRDRWLCDTCSLVASCPYSRPGAVCIVTGSEATGLAAKFKTRRSTDIIDALGSIMAADAERVESAMQKEKSAEKLDPNVSKLMESLFTRGIQLARLVDPALAYQMSNGAKINIVNGVPAQLAVANATPQELMAKVVGELEKEGIKIEDATVNDVETIIGRMGSRDILDVDSIEA
jgi:hypothetical protein